MPIGAEWGEKATNGGAGINFQLMYRIGNGPEGPDGDPASFQVLQDNGAEVAATNLHAAYKPPRHYGPTLTGTRVDFACGHSNHHITDLHIQQQGYDWERVPSSPYTLTLPCGLTVKKVGSE